MLENVEKHGNPHIFIDEYILEMLHRQNLDPTKKQEFFCNFRKAIDHLGPTKYFWMASAGASQNQGNLLEELKSQIFYDFEFPDLKYPLRNQKKIVQYAMNIAKSIKESGENIKSGYYANVDTSFDLSIPSNLADGAEVITVEGMLWMKFLSQFCF